MTERERAMEFVQDWCWEYGLAVDMRQCSGPPALLYAGINVRIKMRLGALVAQSECFMLDYQLHSPGWVDNQLHCMAQELGLFINREKRTYAVG